MVWHCGTCLNDNPRHTTRKHANKYDPNFVGTSKENLFAGSFILDRFCCGHGQDVHSIASKNARVRNGSIANIGEIPHSLVRFVSTLLMWTQVKRDE